MTDKRQEKASKDSHGISTAVTVLLSIVLIYNFLIGFNYYLVATSKGIHINNIANGRLSNTTKITNGTLSTEKDQKVLIVLDASTLDDRGYQPNPVRIRAGDIVIWTNRDTIPHTVTSGTEGANNQGSEFDSNIIGDGKNFEHKFDSLGEFQYFCKIHPNMVGKVIVS